MKINRKCLLLALFIYLPIGMYAGSGDVNGDGLLTSADVMAIANHLIGNQPNGFDLNAADVNNDKDVNVADIVTLQKLIAQSPSATISMNGQTQNGNGSNSHLTTHKYLSNKDIKDLPSLGAANYFSTIHLSLSVPKGDYKTLILQTDNLLTTEAKYNLTTGELSEPTLSTTQALTLKNVNISNGQKIEAYLSIMPCNLSGHKLSVKVYDAKGNIYAVNSTFDGKQFKAGKKYDYSGTISSSTTATCTGLPVVMVNTANGKDITSKDKWMEGATLTIINSDGQVINSSGKAKGRGNNTWALAKKPYTIKFSKKQSPFGFPANKDWALLAEYYDRTLLRTAFMSAVSRAIGMEWTINYRHVNLFLNGVFKGVYVLTDKVEEANNRVKVEKDGFFIEEDTYYKQEKVYFNSSLLLDDSGQNKRGFSFKYPDDDGDIITGDANYNFIKNYIHKMETALNKLISNSNDTEYKQYVDLTSFAKFHVACAAFSLLDPNRFYVLPSRSSKLKMMPMWDAEWSLGLRHTAWGVFPMTTDNTWDRVFYFKYLMKSPEFIQVVKAEWAKFKVKKQQILDEVYAVRDQISTAQVANYKMWPNRNHLSVSFDTWEEEVNNILDFFDERLKYLDKHYAEK